MGVFKLILGTPILASTPRPWEFFKVDGIMVNAREILKNNLSYKVRGRGLRKLLGIDDETELWVDSGGYQFLLHRDTPSLYKLANLYKSIDADYYISLDYPPSPSDPLKIRFAKIARTVRNFLRLKDILRCHLEEGRLVPVLHMSAKEPLKIQLTAYEPHSYTIAVGGLVPYFMQKSGKFSRLKALVFLALARKAWRGEIHALGTASTAIIPLLKKLKIESSDTHTWRHKAAYGKIIVPTIGERHISTRAIKFGPAFLTKNDEKEAVKIHLAKLLENTEINMTLNDLENSFEARATFNAWALKQVATDGFNYSGLSKPFAKLYETADKLLKYSKSDLEEILVKLLGLR